VGCQQVVPVEAETADGRSVVKTSMLPVPIVLMEPAGQLLSSGVRVIVGPGVGPLAQSGLDEAFGFAVGARGVGTGETLGDAEAAAAAVKACGAIAGAVVGEHAGDDDAQAREVADGGLDKSRGGGGFLMGEDLREGNAGVIVDGDVHVFPTGAMNAAAPMAGDAAADGVEASDFFDVEMGQIAGRGVLVAHDGKLRVQDRGCDSAANGAGCG
jgi:hypothetical protein